MIEILAQVFANLRANKLRSFLTMFGILWGVVSVVVLSAMGEGFRRGNDHVLEELGRNLGIIWGGRTSGQAGGERAGRQVRLTAADARALEASPVIAVASAEIQRGGISIRSDYNSASLTVHGIEPQYQDIRTIDVARGRGFRPADEENARRVAVVGAEAARQLFAGRESVGEAIQLNGIPYAIIGVIRRKDQDSSYSGPDNDKVFVPFSAMARDFPRLDAEPDVVSNLVVSPEPWVIEEMPTVLARRAGRVNEIDWPLEQEVRRVLGPRHRFGADDTTAVAMWDTNIQTLMMGRMVDAIQEFFGFVGLVTLALGGIGVMNIMLVAVRERTHEIGLRKALGATSSQIQRQFFLEGFFLTVTSGALGFAIALALCTAINTLPMPTRFQGMTLTWEAGALAVAALAVVGVVTSAYPARRAASLPPVEALRFEA